MHTLARMLMYKRLRNKVGQFLWLSNFHPYSLHHYSNFLSAKVMLFVLSGNTIVGVFNSPILAIAYIIENK